MQINRIQLLAVFSILILYSLNSSYAVEMPWPFFQYDQYHSGRSPKTGPVSDISLQFETNIFALSSSPVIDSSGTVYVGSRDGCLYVIAADGDTADCLYETNAQIISAPAISVDNRIYTVSSAGTLYAIDIISGALIWSLELGHAVTASPVIDHTGRIMIATGSSDDPQNGTLYCINPNGTIAWEFTAGAFVYAAPALDQQGTTYAGSFDAVVYALDSSGELIWQFDTGDLKITAPAAVASDNIYITTDTSVVALDYYGNELWRYTPMVTLIAGYEIESGTSAMPAVDHDGNLYIGGASLGDLHCIDSSGQKIWSLMIDSLNPKPILSSPLIDRNNTAYVRILNNLYAFKSSGTRLFDAYDFAPVPDDLSINVDREASMGLGANQTLYIPSVDGNIYAVSEHKETFDLSGTIQGVTDEGITISLKGAVEMETVTDTKGSFSFNGLPEGSYLVTPVSKHYEFSPATLTADISKSSVSGFEFLSILPATTPVPSETKTGITPNLETGTCEIIFSTKLLQSGDIITITIDLSTIGGDALQQMYDDGTHGDEIAGDGIFSFLAETEPVTSPGLHPLTITTIDSDGKIFKETTLFEIVNQIIKTVHPDSTTVHTFHNDREGQYLLISYSLGGAGFNRLQSSRQACSILLDILTPQGAYYQKDIPVMQNEGMLKIKKAAAGTWTYSLRNNCPQSNKVALNTSGTFMGLIAGVVIDAETGENLNNVYITTDGGGKTSSADGFYSLVHIEGLFSLTTDLEGYQPITKKVSVSSSSLDPVDLVLLPETSPFIPQQTEENSTTGCPAKKSGFSTVTLKKLYSLRDNVLQKSQHGKTFTAAYYRHSREIMKIFTNYPELRRKFKNCIFICQAHIDTLIKNQNSVLTREQAKSIEELLNDIADYGSPELQSDIKSFLNLYQDTKTKQADQKTTRFNK